MSLFSMYIFTPSY